MSNQPFVITRVAIDEPAASLPQRVQTAIGNAGMAILQYTDRVAVQTADTPIDTTNLIGIDAFTTSGDPCHLTATVAGGMARGVFMSRGEGVGTHITCTHFQTRDAMCLGEVTRSNDGVATLGEFRIKPYDVPLAARAGDHLSVQYEEWIAPDEDGQCRVVGYAATGIQTAEGGDA